MKTEKKIPVWAAAVIPVLLIIAVILSVYLPGDDVLPEYDFIYSAGRPEQAIQQRYTVEKGKITKNEVLLSGDFRYIPEVSLYYYDVSDDSSNVITLNETQTAAIDTSLVSPDGFEVIFGNIGRDAPPILLDTGSDSVTVYFKGHGRSQKLNIDLRVDRRRYYFKFLGWVIK
ncbi:hypothetical protein ACFL7D_02480 [candidate division KSB1 bacterium]